MTYVGGVDQVEVEVQKEKENLHRERESWRRWSPSRSQVQTSAFTSKVHECFCKTPAANTPAIPSITSRGCDSALERTSLLTSQKRVNRLLKLTVVSRLEFPSAKVSRGLNKHHDKPKSRLYAGGGGRKTSLQRVPSQGGLRAS